MKILDQKGRLFGIINIVDLLLIIVIIAIAWAGFNRFSAHNTLGSTNQLVESKPGEAIIKVKIPLVDPAYVSSLHKGDYLVTGDSLTKSYIMDIKVSDGIYERTSNDGNIVVNKHPYKKDLYITVYGYVSLQGATIKLDKQTVRVGKTFYLKTRTTELTGIVNSVQIVKE